MPYIGQRPSKGDENNFKILDDISSYTLTFDGSDASVVSAANDTITSLTHRFVQGQRVTYNNGGGSNIAGLTSGTVYYIIKHDHHNIKLATSASNAANGIAVNITNVGSGASHTINVAFDGVNTKFKATHTNGQKAKITRSAQLVISINGVIQQPHDTATPSTGFGFDLDGTIVFSQAPVSTDEYWAHVLTNNNVTFDISDNDIDNFTGDGSTTEFNLSKSPPDNRNILVTIDGVVQYPNDPDGTARAYVVVENVLTFNSAPDSGVEIQVRHIGFAGSTSGSGGVTNFYGRTGSVVLKDTDNISVNDAAVTGDLTVTGDMTVNGDFTTLNTSLREVELLHVDADSSTTAGIITQRGSGDILNLFDNNSEVLTVTDGGQIGINSTTPSNGALIDIGVPTTKTGGLDSTVSIASTHNKTYPNVASFSVTLGLKQEFEVGGTQTLNPSSPGGFNFITGITNFMRKKNDNVQDIERSYYAGINQNFFWNDENTLKQYRGITDSLSYFGKDANGRTTNYLIANQIAVNAGAGKTQTVNRIYGEELRFQNFAGDGSTPTTNVTHWSGFRPALYWFLINSNYTGTITDAIFYDTSNSWGVTVSGSGSATHTISNLYGLRLRPPGNSTGLTITNNYGVYQEWSSAKNYFAGNVGIGENNPTSKLVVNGTSQFQDDATFQTANGGNIVIDKSDNSIRLGESVGLFYGVNKMWMQHNGSTGYLHNVTGSLYIRNEDSSGDIYIQGKSGENSIICNYDGNVQLYNDGTIRFNTTSTGVTVHGSADPDLKIRQGASSSSGSGFLAYENVDGNGQPRSIAKIQGKTKGNGGYGELNFQTQFDNTLSTRLTINENGNVGINSTIPAAKLDVNGTSHFQDNVRIVGFTTFSNELQITPSNSSSYTTHLNYNNTGTNFISHANSGATHFRNSSSGGTAMSIQGSNKAVDIYSDLRHLGDTDTLMQFGDNTINLTAGGTTGLTVYDTNVRIPTKLGINGAAPQTPLDVVADGSGYAINVRGRSSDNVGEIRFTSNNYGSLYSVLQTGATYLNFQVGSVTNALRIDSDGDVIIGTSSWQYKKPLNVQGSSGHILSLYNADTTTYAANTLSGIELKLLTGNTGNQFGSCEIRAFKENGTNGDNARALSFYTGVNGGAPNERLRITSAGEVKIANGGFLTFDTDVSGNYALQEAIRIDDGAGTGDRALQFFEYHHNGVRYHRIQFNTNTTTNGSAYTYTQGNYGGSSAIEFEGNGELRFFTNASDSSGSASTITPSERLRITNTGGLKFTSQTTTIETAGITHHTNNNLYIRGGSSGLVLSNDDSTNTIHISESNFIKFETNDGSEKMRIESDGQVSISSDGTTDGLLTIKGNSDATGTPSIRLLDGSDTREVSISNQSGDLIMSTHGTDNVAHGEIKIFDSGLIHLNTNGSNNRLVILTNGRMGISQSSPDAASLHIGNSNASTGSNVALQVGTITGQNRYLTINHFGGQQNFYQLKMRVNDNQLIPMLDMGNPYGSQNHGTKIKFSGYNDSEVGAIESVNTAANSTSSVDMVFRTGSGPKEVLRLQSNGDARFYNGLAIAKYDNDTSNFARSGLVLSTPTYNEYHYVWGDNSSSGGAAQSSHTITLTCGSYFHAEFIYTQHQTNGGHQMHTYARGKWANNHTTHTGFMYEFSGGGSGLNTSFTVSDQSGNGSVDLKNGLTAAGSPGASYRGSYGGGHEGTSSSANGMFVIDEVYQGSALSVSTRGLVIRVFYGSFSIARS